MKIHFVLIFLLSSWLAIAVGQAQPRDAFEDDEYDYNEEFTYGVNFNTNGGLIGGVAFKYARAQTPLRYQTFGLEIVNVKHPQEFRVTFRGSPFIPNKVDYLFAIRPNYGTELVLFRKAPDDGVHLNAIFAVGPSLGLLKPYYVVRDLEPNVPGARTINVQNGPEVPINQIIGTAPFTEGFDNLRLRMGGHAKAGLSFEFGRFNNSVVGIEIGLLAEAFTRKIIILPDAENRAVFTSAFLTLYYGNKY